MMMMYPGTAHAMQPSCAADVCSLHACEVPSQDLQDDWHFFMLHCVKTVSITMYECLCWSHTAIIVQASRNLFQTPVMCPAMVMQYAYNIQWQTRQPDLRAYLRSFH